MDNIDVKFSDDFILILDSLIKKKSDLIDEKRTHRIKLHPNYFDRIISGQKTFEIRKNDRD